MSETKDEAVEATEAAGEAEARQAQEGPGKPSPKRSKKPVIVAAVVVVIAALGAGMWVWHEQPGFCGTACHTPMNDYAVTFEQPAGAAGIDKWGSDVSNCDAMLAVSHREADLNCLSCHTPTVGQQLGEVAKQITGDYSYPLEEVSTDQLMANSVGGAGDGFCLREGCHEVTREGLTELTADLAWNPHRWQHQEFACSDCHKSHRASVMKCGECHGEATEDLPDGWVSADEGERIAEQALSA